MDYKRTFSSCFGSLLLLTVACDKSESLGEVEDSSSEGMSDGDGDSEGEETESDGESDSGVACPTDAMICPDGSAVGRIGPQCEFAPCPGEDPGCDKDAMICPDGTAVGREGPDCEFAECPGGELTCDAGDDAVEPATCPNEGPVPNLELAGCYEPCDTEGEACANGDVCRAVQINPCPCNGEDEEGGMCCGACAAETTLCLPVQADPVCDAVIGETFYSVDELECGPSRGEQVLCKWQIMFGEDGSYSWLYSDIGEGGTYTCSGGVLTVDDGTGIQASYDPNTGMLTWEDIEYSAGMM